MSRYRAISASRPGQIAPRGLVGKPSSANLSTASICVSASCSLNSPQAYAKKRSGLLAVIRESSCLIDAWPGRSIPWIGKGFLAEFALPRIEFFEVFLSHVGFAANLQNIWPAAIQICRYVNDHERVRGHVFADFPGFRVLRPEPDVRLRTAMTMKARQSWVPPRSQGDPTP